MFGSLVLLFYVICSHVAAKKQEEPFNSLWLLTVLLDFQVSKYLLADKSTKTKLLRTLKHELNASVLKWHRLPVFVAHFASDIVSLSLTRREVPQAIH